MPIAPDLGFIILAVVVSAIGLVLRRKWRLSVARAEEVRRMLVLASEESVRAELEASAVYVSQSKAPLCSSPVVYHQCDVCFNPSTTRCSRCKSVRYCSGKCQIIHWRKGHKRECRPFTTIYQNIYSEGVPSQKFLEQENEIHGNDIETEGQYYARYIQSTPEESRTSNLDGHPEAVGRNDESEVEHLLHTDEKDLSLHETERSVKMQSANALPAKLKSNCVKNMKPNGITCLGKSDDIKSGSTRSTPTTSSSGSSADGPTESSFSEPSTSSCGFWDGGVDSRRTKLDARDDSSQSSSSEAGDTDLHTSRSSPKVGFNFCLNSLQSIDGRNSSPKIVMPEDTPPNLGTKKTIHRVVSSQEKIEDVSGKNGSLPSVFENSDCMGFPVLKVRDPQSCTPCVTTTKSSGLMSVSSDKSNDGVTIVGDTSSTLRPLESKESGIVTSSVSIAHSSTTRTRSVEVAKPLKVGNAHAGGASSDYANNSLNARNGLKTSTCKVVDNLKVSKVSSHRHSAAEGEVAGRYTNKGLFSYDVFVKLYNWNNIDMQPCGLTNCGNSCYANAVLQCLAWTPPITAYLLQGLHSKACEKKEWCLTCELEILIMKARQRISPLSPSRILSKFQKIGGRLGNGREEDAHEFLRYAIDSLQSVCVKEARLSEPSSLEEETTLIGLTFGGYLRSKIKCMRCGGKSEHHERMMDLTVEIEGDIGTLEAALRKFTCTEVLDGENKYQCSRCKSYEKAKKKLKVLEAPNILTIALKRFQSGKFGKLNKSIQFPEILNLAPYMSGTSDKSPIYKLYGVVVHLDIMNATFSGHYVCYVKNLQNKWFKIDDSVVTAVESADVLSKRAYMLLYARCSPRAPRLIRNSVIPPDPRKPNNPLLKLRSLSSGPWDEPSNRHTGIDCLYPNRSNFHHKRRVFEDDSSSENSSLFSEVCSCSTESSNRDSSSTDEFFDHLFGDSDQNWNTMWKRSSDSDTSSSSSSSSTPTPLYTKRSPLSNSDEYSSHVENAGPIKGDSFGVRTVTSLNSCKLDSSSSNSNSCRATNSDRLGLA